jgi:hypothetical protein
MAGGFLSKVVGGWLGDPLERPEQPPLERLEDLDFLLDTNACIKILNNASMPLVARLKKHHPAHIKFSSVVKAELF